MAGRRTGTCWWTRGHTRTVASPQRPANLYRREDVILAQIVERIGQDVLSESHLEAWSAVVQAMRDQGLTIVCAPEGCPVTEIDVDTTGMTTQSVQEPLLPGHSDR